MTTLNRVVCLKRLHSIENFFITYYNNCTKLTVHPIAGRQSNVKSKILFEFTIRLFSTYLHKIMYNILYLVPNTLLLSHVVPRTNTTNIPRVGQDLSTWITTIREFLRPKQIILNVAI